jgi:topoisomerase IA-like protein
VRAGILDDHHGPGDVVAAVLADPSLGDRHKQVLLDIYQSLRAEHAAAEGSGIKTAARKTAARKTTARKPAARKTAGRATGTTSRRKSS